MFLTKPSKLALTLLFYTSLALALVATADAKGFASTPLHHRGHADLTRMIKKRVPADANPIVNPLSPASEGAAPNPPSDTSNNGDSNGSNAAGGGSNPQGSSSSSAASASASATSSSAQVSSQSSTAATSSVTSQSTQSSSSSSQSASSSNALSSLLNSLTSTGTSSAPTSTTPPTSASAQPTSASPNLQDAPGPASIAKASIDAITLTSSLPAASQTASSSQNTPQGSSKLSHTAVNIIIVLASCIGGTAIIWTVIRKWKFRPSSQFEDRMQPIDWQPTDHDSGLPTHRRVPSNASSFHSSGHDGASTRGYGATSENVLNPIPDHDFTAGAMTLAPGEGYADLARGASPGPYARGPSPQPQMESLNRGPSLTRTHDEYGMPLHHQGGYNGY